ncbi:hypothetical protein [Rubrobacter marinus]|uniref:hypothetical protein n=1 Tax=Rubrobacter marinus TaxID=2653852 RepID=UPI001408F58C|nr:hypothetical protein [Rubrobacter marinus]
MSETEQRAVEASDFRAARRVWHEEMISGPDPYADPARWLGCTDAEDDERRAR